MSKEKVIEYIKDSLLEIPDIDADRGYPALMRVKENFNEMLKELEDLNMNRKEAAELSPIIKAFSEGRPIQYRIKDNKSAKWNDVDKNYHTFSPHSFMYRIKPEPKYRPFKDKKECWTEMQKHQPVGWVKQINGKGIEVCIHCGFIKGDWVLTAVDEVPFPFDGMYNNYTFADGTTFGVKVEE